MNPSAIAPQLPQYAGRFGGQRNARTLTESEAANVVVHIFLPNAQAHFDSADIARMGQHHRHQQDSIDANVGIVNGAAEDRQHSHVTVDRALGTQTRGLERSRKRDRFKYGSWLERHRYGMVLPVQRSLAGLRRKIWIVGGIAGQREYVSVLRIDGNHAAGFRMVRLDSRGQFAFSDELQALIDSQLNRRTGPRAALQLGIDAPPLHIGQQPNMSRHPAQIGFERSFHAGAALLFEID